MPQNEKPARAKLTEAHLHPPACVGATPVAFWPGPRQTTLREPNSGNHVGGCARRPARGNIVPAP